MKKRLARPAQPMRRKSRPPWVYIATAVLAAVVLILVFPELRPGRATNRHLADLLDPGDAKGYNLLLVTLDTFRWDRMGSYGYEGNITPTLDGLLAHGIRFEQAVASVPLTLPSHATILTGLYPPRHGARDNGLYTVSPKVVTLAEGFQSEGYTTAAFVGAFVLDQRYGLDQGFDLYDFEVSEAGYRPQMVEYNERPANELTDAVIGWLNRRQADPAERSKPFFLWVHYFDPHLPYRSPLQQMPQFAANGYDAEIAFVDSEFRRLVNTLDQLGARDRTLIAVVADHGESLGEHKEPTHGILIYDSTVRVPFFLSCPSLFRRSYREADRLVGTVDLAPTLRDLCGLPEVEGDGISLVRHVPDRGRAVYLETLGPSHVAGWSPLFGLRTLRTKYILAPDPEFYNLSEDPDETQNRHAEGRSEVSRLEDELRAYQKTWENTVDSARRLDDEEMERLASLGYLQMSREAPASTLADPKAMMDVYNDGLRSETLYFEKRYADAATLAERVVERSPRFVHAIRVLAFSYLRLGQPEKALSFLRSRTDELADPFLMRSLAQALILNERFDEAREVLSRYEDLDSSDGQTYILRGDILAIEGRTEEARRSYERAAQMDPKRAGLMATERIARLGLGGGG